MVFLVGILFREGDCHLDLLDVPKILLDLLAMSLLHDIILFVVLLKVAAAVLLFVVGIHGVLVIDVFPLRTIHEVDDLGVIVSGQNLAFHQLV